MNMAAALAFIPAFRGIREMESLPEAGNPFYAWTIAICLFFFGIAYLWLAFSETRQTLLILIGALGKVAFAILLIGLVLFGELPVRAALSGLSDLVIALIFFVWLGKTTGRFIEI